MAFDPAKLATAAQTFDDDTQAKCLTCEVGEHNNFVCNGSSCLSAVSYDAYDICVKIEFLPRFMMLRRLHAYSSAEFGLKGHRRLTTLNNNTDSRVDFHNRITRQVLHGDAYCAPR